MQALRGGRRYRHVWYGFSLFALTTSLIFGFLQSFAGAAGFSRAAADPTIESSADVYYSGACQNQTIYVSLDSLDIKTLSYVETTQGCVTTGATVDTAVYTSKHTSYSIGVKFHGEMNFHRLAISPSAVLTKSTDLLTMLVDRGAISPSKLVTYTYLPAALKPATRNSLGVVSLYQLDETKGQAWLQYNKASGGTDFRNVSSFVASSNGRYILAYVEYNEFVRINLDNGDVKIVAKVRGAWYDGIFGSTASAISDDGSYAYVGGTETVYQTANCGDRLGDEINLNALVSPCALRALYYKILPSVNYHYHSRNVQFIDDGQGLTFEAFALPGAAGASVQITMHGSGYVPAPRLEYLAMGDSYSSGEGDIEKTSGGVDYYTPITDIEGGCHISTRSYPFLLRDYWGISEDSMQSVACSGARVVFDYDHPLDGYAGQGNRLDKYNFTQNELVQHQQLSLEKFIPGNVPQLEFVKEYQPKIITLTGGGNDVGFADIMQYCASTFETCGFANDVGMSKMLDDAIDGQYAYNSRLINDVKSDSPGSKIYIIGYPIFLADGDHICGANSALLDGKEIVRINTAVSRMNSMLARVAGDTGVMFVDIERSLDGGRICEGSEYVTGAFDAYFKTGDVKNGIFHPNALGHQKMAQAIEAEVGSNPYDGSPRAIKSDWTSSLSDYINTIFQNFVPTGLVSTQDGISIQSDPHSFEAGTSVRVSIHSDEVYAGSYVTNNDGALAVSIPVPDGLPLGYHLITLRGVSPSGEPVTYVQFVTINSDILNDIDADGIPDNQDVCQFVSSWYDEMSGDNICDAFFVPTNNAESSVRGSNVLPVTSVTTSVSKYDNAELDVAVTNYESSTGQSDYSAVSSLAEAGNRGVKSEPPSASGPPVVLIAVVALMITSGTIIGKVIYARTSSKNKK